MPRLEGSLEREFFENHPYEVVSEAGSSWFSNLSLAARTAVQRQGVVRYGRELLRYSECVRIAP
ncbi:MAG TPA: hypothetical protein VIY49_33060 [Bryobacteraceae bacterium]